MILSNYVFMTSKTPSGAEKHCESTKCQRAKISYRIAGKFGGQKIWRIARNRREN